MMRCCINNMELNMTIIVNGVTTKKQLKEQPGLARFNDPSMFSPMHGGRMFKVEDIREGEVIVCTNHPKRTWFAVVSRVKGVIVIE